MSLGGGDPNGPANDRPFYINNEAGRIVLTLAPGVACHPIELALVC